MTHLKVEQNNTVIEQIDGEVIEKLYQLAFSGDLDASSNLVGRLYTTATYQQYVDFLTQQFQDLYISADKYYVKFSDDNFQKLTAMVFGDGVGVTEVQLATVTNINTQYTNYIRKNNQQSLANSIQSVDLRPFRNFIEMNQGMGADIPNVTYFNSGSGTVIGEGTYAASIGFRDGLQIADFPNCETLNAWALYNYPNLEEVYLPKMKTSGLMFRSTPKLSFVYIGDQCTSLTDFFSLSGVTSCTCVINTTTPPSATAVTSQWENVQVYVPDNSVSSYQQHSDWSGISSQIHPISQLPQTYQQKIANFNNRNLTV